MTKMRSKTLGTILILLGLFILLHHLYFTGRFFDAKDVFHHEFFEAIFFTAGIVLMLSSWFSKRKSS